MSDLWQIAEKPKNAAVNQKRWAEMVEHLMGWGVLVPAEPNYEAAADAYIKDKIAMYQEAHHDKPLIGVAIEMRHIIAAVDAALGEPA